MSTAIDGKALSVMPTGARTTRAGPGRSGFQSGATQAISRPASAASSGSTVSGARSGWVRVTVPAASSVRARIAISAGDLAPRPKLTHGTQEAPSPSLARSWAIAQTRSQGMVAPAASTVAGTASTPWPLIGWRQRWLTVARTYSALRVRLNGARMLPSTFGCTPWLRMIVYCWAKVMVLFATQ